MTESSDFLYHYTDVDTLALILKNRTIRLNSLNKMDDLQEQQSDDIQNFGKLIFVSSWTSEEKEDIPMWRLYSPKQKGVRIKLRKNPFRTYPFTTAEIISCIKNPNIYIEHEPRPSDKSIVPINAVFNDSYMVENYIIQENDNPYHDILFETHYTDDPNLLNPKIIICDGAGRNVHIKKLGIYKSNYWEFQKEYRYILYFLPLSANAAINATGKERLEIIKDFNSNLDKGFLSLPFSYYDLIIDDNCFSEMEITLCPDANESSRIIVNLLCEKYNSTANIKPSNLTGLLR